MTIAPVAPLPAPPAPEMHEPQRQPAGHAFAELLRQNRAPDAAPKAAQPPVAGTDADPPQDANPAATQPRNRTSGSNAAAGSLRPATRTAGDKASTDGSDAHTVEGHEGVVAESPRRDDATPGATPDAVVVQWLADLQLPPATTAALQRGRHDAGDATDVQLEGAAAGSAVEASGRDKASAGEAREARDTGRRPGSKDEPGRDALEAAKLREHFGAAGALAGRGSETAQASRPGAPAEALNLPPAAFNPAQAPAASAPPAEVRIDTPFARPEFAQAFGLQVSLLARDGIHRAELHLNPADMGPVSVQISVDGTQARVDFGADHAATRLAIETGLPELASALRDAGLTLSGGGVSQHSRGGGEADHGPGQRGHGPASSTAAEAEPVRPLPQRMTVAGGIDLYA